MAAGLISVAKGSGTCGADVPVRIAWLAVPALCVGNALAYFGSAMQPMWVASFMKNGLLTASSIGWLASGELLLIAVSSLTVAAFAKRTSPRTIAISAALLIALANGLAMFFTVEAVVTGRLLSGLATGALLASITGVAVRRRGSQRVLAVMQASVLLLISTVTFMLPVFIGPRGPVGLFALTAGFAVIVAILGLFGMPDRAHVDVVVRKGFGSSKLAPLLGCLALASVAVGLHTLTTYTIIIGTGLGFSARELGAVLAATTPLCILGPLAARFLGERAGLVRPLHVALILISIDVFFVVNAPTPLLFGISNVILPIGGGFCIPYAIALVGRLDPSGRFASVLPAFIMLGGAGGPAIGGKLIGAFPFEVLAAAAAVGVLIGMLLFAIATGIKETKASTQNQHSTAG